MARNLIYLLLLCLKIGAQPIPVFSGGTTIGAPSFSSTCGSGSGCGLVGVFEPTSTSGFLNTFDLMATSFICPQSGIFCQADLYLQKGTTPTSDLQCWLQSDIFPGAGTSISSTSIVVNASTLPGSFSYVSFKDISATVTAGNRYWIVMQSIPKGTIPHTVTWQYGTIVNGLTEAEQCATFNTGDFIWTTYPAQQFWIKVYTSAATRGAPAVRASWTNSATVVSNLANNSVTVDGCCPSVLMGLSYYSSVDAVRSTPTLNGVTNNWTLLSSTNWTTNLHGHVEWWYHVGSRWGIYPVTNHWSTNVESAQMWIANITNGPGIFDPSSLGWSAFKTNTDTSITNINNLANNVTNELIFSMSTYPTNSKSCTLGFGQSLLASNSIGAQTFFVSSKYGYPSVTNWFSWGSGATNGMGQVSVGLLGF